MVPEEGFNWRRGHAVLWWLLVTAGHERRSLRRDEVHGFFAIAERLRGQCDGGAMCGGSWRVADDGTVRSPFVERLLRAECGMVETIGPLPPNRMPSGRTPSWIDAQLSVQDRLLLERAWWFLMTGQPGREPNPEGDVAERAASGADRRHHRMA